MEFIQIITENYRALLTGAMMTAAVSGLSIGLGMVLGLNLAFGLISKHWPIRRFCAAYRSLLRGTPMLVQLFIVFYLLPKIGLDVPSIMAAIIAITMNTAAFQAEIYRGGLLTISPGQTEAARMLGIKTRTIRIRIIIPQVLRLVLPPLVNEMIAILKNSSLISVIAVTELMRTSQHIVSVTFRPLEVYILAAAIYLTMNIIIAKLGSLAEGRLTKGTRI
jgi:polar amino acid transport system permease protein